MKKTFCYSVSVLTASCPVVAVSNNLENSCFLIVPTKILFLLVGLKTTSGLLRRVLLVKMLLVCESSFGVFMCFEPMFKIRLAVTSFTS